MSYLAVVTTVARREEARAIARQMVSQNLAACAQISQIESIYHWDDAIQQESEYRILFKTLAENYTALENAIKAIHPYELPAIHAIHLDRVETLYGHWITQHSQGLSEVGRSPQ